MSIQGPDTGAGQVSPETLRRRTMQGGIVATSALGARLVVHFVMLTVLARVLTPEDFGLYAMAAVVTGFVANFVDLGLTDVTIQRRTLSNEAISGFFYINIALGLFLAVLAIVVAPAAARFFEEPLVAPLIMVLSLMLPLLAAGRQHTALLRREMRWRTAEAIVTGSAVAGAAASIGAALWGMGVWSLVVHALFTLFVEVVALWIWMRWRPGRIGAWDEIRSGLRFGWNVTVFAVLTYLHRQSDDAMIGARWGVSDLGFYNRAYTLLLVPIQFFRGALTTVAVPVLSRLQDDDKAWTSLYANILGGALLVMVPMCLVLYILVDEIILVLFGPGWEDAVLLFQILSVSIVPQLVMNSTGWLWISRNQTGQLLRWAVISVPIMITGMLIGLPYGAAGVATGYVATFFFLTPASSWMVTQTLPITMSEIYRPIAAPVAAGLAGFALASVLLVQPLAQAALALVVYTLVIAIVSRQTIVAMISLLKESLGR